LFTSLLCLLTGKLFGDKRCLQLQQMGAKIGAKILNQMKEEHGKI